MFTSEEESHNHSLEVLNLLYQYNDFMDSVSSLCDMGCGTGADLEWWATRMAEDDNENYIPLEINCTGIDTLGHINISEKYDNIEYISSDFEKYTTDKKYDIIWSHDSFQYALNPIQTLKNWNSMLDESGMLVLILPQTVNIEYNRQQISLQNNQFYHHSLVSLIHMLVINGFDCKTGFFNKQIDDHWISIVVYKSDIAPLYPGLPNWYELAETGLLPVSAVNGINERGYLHQDDLILPWLDKSTMGFGNI